MFSLRHRIALVTGAGRGIGRAIALALAQAGARVALTARTEFEVEDAAKEIRDFGATALPLVADLTDPEAPRRLLDQTVGAIGPVDILVNNAGIGSSPNPKPVVSYDDDFWDLTLLLNLTAPYRLSKLVLPGMIDRQFGRIINVASINGKIPSLHGAAYAASKHGLLGLTKTLALEVAKDGITVNAICPGPVHTAMNDRRLQYDAQRRGITVKELEEGLTPIGGRLEPEDVAPLAVYLASDEAKMVTGQSWNIDGGIVMAG